MKKLGNCTYCGRQLMPADRRLSSGAFHPQACSEDHVVPRSVRAKGKTVRACRCCDNMKADLLPDEWRAFCASHPKWWQLYPKTAKAILSQEMRSVMR